ncbi:MAG: NosD domain-containing protein, partial [Promethearchaeota archaeon]
SSENGIHLDWSTNIHVIHNRCFNNGKGIWLYQSDENVVRDNICRDNLLAGIALWSSDSNTVTKNNSTGNGYSGIYLQFSSDNDVVTNVCNLNGFSGIFLYVSTGNSITGNTCNNNTVDGISLTEGSNGNTVNDNHCSYNINAGISVISANGNDISRNKVYVDINLSGVSYGFYLEYSDSNTLSGNFISSNSYGISMFYSSSNLVFHNCIRADLIEAEDWYSTYGNYWYHPVLLEGNSWFDYTGADLNGDGIGDTDIPWPGPGFDLYPLVIDSDGDGLSNCVERFIGTDPHNPDTDGDHFNDGDEWSLYHTDPLTPTSPQEAAEAINSRLQDLVNSKHLARNDAWPLKRKVDAAIALMNRGHWVGAAQKLSDFKKQVRAKISSGALSQEDGATLIAMAQGIIDAIQATQP